jgi:hypothetical protein
VSEPRDLSHLIPSKKVLDDMAERAAEGALLSQFLRGLGVRRSAIAEGERQSKDGRLSLDWFANNFSSFPFNVYTTRIQKCEVEDFFDRPSKTAAFERFTEAFGSLWKTEPCVMLFKAQCFHALALYTSPVMGCEVAVALRFRLRGHDFYVSTMKEFTNAYCQRAGAVDS